MNALQKQRKERILLAYLIADNAKYANVDDVAEAFGLDKNFSNTIQDTTEKYRKRWESLFGGLSWSADDKLFKEAYKGIEKKVNEQIVKLKKAPSHPFVKSEIEVGGKQLTVEQKIDLLMEKGVWQYGISHNERKGSVFVTIERGKLRQDFEFPKEKEYKKISELVKKYEIKRPKLS
jgi:hypothetical protein